MQQGDRNQLADLGGSKLATRSPLPDVQAVIRAWRKVMKFFALGAYGKIGLPAVKLLAQCDLVTEIAIGARNLERAEKTASEIGKKAVAVLADGPDGPKSARISGQSAPASRRR